MFIQREKIAPPPPSSDDRAAEESALKKWADDEDCWVNDLVQNLVGTARRRKKR